MVRLWDVDAGKERAILRGHTEGVTCVAFAPDGKALASNAFDGTIRVWDSGTGGTKAALPTEERQLRYVLLAGRVALPWAASRA